MSCTRRKLILPMKIEHKLRYPTSTETPFPWIANEIIPLWRESVQKQDIAPLHQYLDSIDVKPLIMAADGLDFIGYLLELIDQSSDRNYLLDLPLLRSLFSRDPISYMLSSLRWSDVGPHFGQPVRSILSYLRPSEAVDIKSLNRVLNVCIKLNVNPFIAVFFSIIPDSTKLLSLLGYELFSEYKPYNELADLIMANKLDDTEKNPFGIYTKSISEKQKLLTYHIRTLFNSLSDIGSKEHVTFMKSPLPDNIKHAIGKLMDFLIRQRMLTDIKAVSIGSLTKSPNIWSPIEKSKNYESNVLDIFGEYMDIFEKIDRKLLPTNIEILDNMARNYFNDQKIDVGMLLNTDITQEAIDSTLVELGFFMNDVTHRSLEQKARVKQMVEDYNLKTQEAKNEYTITLYERLLYLIFLYLSQADVHRVKFSNIIQSSFRFGIITRDRPISLSNVRLKIYVPFESEAFVRTTFLNKMFEYLGDLPALFYISFFSEINHVLYEENYLLPMYTLGDYKNLTRCLTYFNSYDDTYRYGKLCYFMMDLINLEMIMESNATMEHIQMLESVKRLIDNILTNKV